MARLRTVKPEYWTDEAVGQCSRDARLLFIATWNFADDHGGLARSSKQLKAQAFPYDDIDCEPLVQELLKAGLLIEYQSGGKKYLHIKGFSVHQKVEKKGKPRVPAYDPPEDTSICEGSFPDPSPTPRGSSPTSSGSSLGSGVESSRVESNRHEERASVAGEMAGELRRAGVQVTSAHPTLLAWITDGFTLAQTLEAVQVARSNGKPAPENIPANYLDRILRQPARPPPVDALSKLKWRPPPDDETDRVPN